MRRNFVMMLAFGAMLLSQGAMAAADKPAVQTSAEVQPSLVDTLTWLKSKVDNEGGWENKRYRQWYRWSNDGCAVRIEMFLDTESKGGRATGYIAFNLADIGEAKLYGPGAPGKIILQSRSGNSITLFDDGKEGRHGGIYVDFFENRDIAGRVAAALTHAAKLCQSKAPREVF